MSSISEMIRSALKPNWKLERRVAALESQQERIMATEADLQAAVTGLTTAVKTYQETITTELATLEGQITALQTQLASAGSPPVTQAQLDDIVAQLGTVQSAVSALPVAPAA